MKCELVVGLAVGLGTRPGSGNEGAGWLARLNKEDS